jgi:hypothetical protein
MSNLPTSASTDSSRRCAASDFAAAALRRSRPSASRAVRPGWSANGYDVQLREEF